MTAFEARLAGLFEEYAHQAPTEFETSDVLEVIRPVRRHGFGLTSSLRRRPWLIAIILTALLLLALATSVLVGAMLLTHNLPPDRPLVVNPTGFMAQQRAGAAAATLADGRVVILGGRNGYVGANQFFAEVYDPDTRTFTPTGGVAPMNAGGGTATVLNDGRVLYTGGSEASHGALATALLYDAETETFLSLPDMLSARSGHSATLLPDGRVVVIGGANGSAGSPIATEYFDPDTLQFAAGPDPDELRHASNIAFPTGGHSVSVYVRGHLPGLGAGLGASLVVFDTTTGQVSQSAPSPPSLAADLTISGASRLIDGRVAMVLAGPSAARSGGDLLIVFDPTNQTFSDPVDLGGIVVVGPATLADGRVLLGEHTIDVCLDVFAEVFDPRAWSVDRVGQIGGIGGCVAGAGATVTALDDGSALITGGFMSSGQETSSASLVHP